MAGLAVMSSPFQLPGIVTSGLFKMEVLVDMAYYSRQLLKRTIKPFQLQLDSERGDVGDWDSERPRRHTILDCCSSQHLASLEHRVVRWAGRQSRRRSTSTCDTQ